jgi:hypothetical protein
MCARLLSRQAHSLHFPWRAHAAQRTIPLDPDIAKRSLLRLTTSYAAVKKALPPGKPSSIKTPIQVSIAYWHTAIGRARSIPYFLSTFSLSGCSCSMKIICIASPCCWQQADGAEGTRFRPGCVAVLAAQPPGGFKPPEGLNPSDESCHSPLVPPFLTRQSMRSSQHKAARRS